MTHTERLKAVTQGKTVDRPAFAAWGPHLCLSDRNLADFVKATIDYQTCFDFDFIKVMPNGMYFPEAFGQKLEPARHWFDETWRTTTKYLINHPVEWTKLKAPSLKEGPLAREIEAVKRICDHFQGDVPVLPTLFSPFELMGEMTGGYSRQEIICAHFKYSEQYARIGLDIVSEVNMQLADAFVEAGADGFFLAYQGGLAGKLGKELFEGIAKPKDIETIRHIQDKTWFNMAHVCNGNSEYFKWFLDYPVDAFNWADQHAGEMSLAEARTHTDKVLVGGLEHAATKPESIEDKILLHDDLWGSDRNVIKAHLKAKVKKTLADAGPKVVVSGGCSWGLGALPRFNLWHEVMDELGLEQAAAG